MTNFEKFIEVFGHEPETSCPFVCYNNCLYYESDRSCKINEFWDAEWKGEAEINNVLGETVSLEVFKQVMGERDIAIEQLKELGYEFGQKIEPQESDERRSRMTNGDKLLETCPNLYVCVLYLDLHYIHVRDRNTEYDINDNKTCMRMPIDWWNAEYKEKQND